jgi:hypothetical protein
VALQDVPGDLLVQVSRKISILIIAMRPNLVGLINFHSIAHTAIAKNDRLPELSAAQPIVSTHSLHITIGG